MCEFRVFLDDQLVMEDVIFAKLNDQGVVLGYNWRDKGLEQR